MPTLTLPRAGFESRGCLYLHDVGQLLRPAVGEPILLLNHIDHVLPGLGDPPLVLPETLSLYVDLSGVLVLDFLDVVHVRADEELVVLGLGLDLHSDSAQLLLLGHLLQKLDGLLHVVSRPPHSHHVRS